MPLARPRRLARPIIILCLLLGLMVLGKPPLAARLMANNDTMVNVSRDGRAINIDVGIALFLTKRDGTANVARKVRNVLDGGGVNRKISPPFRRFW